METHTYTYTYAYTHLPPRHTRARTHTDMHTYVQRPAHTHNQQI